jgi:hypothetical protein
MWPATIYFGYGPIPDSCISADKLYSITSSAPTKMEFGIVKPSKVAVRAIDNQFKGGRFLYGNVSGLGTL